MNISRTGWLTLLLVVCACRNRKEITMPLQVEIDVFSGRPNPVFTIADTEMPELESLLASLPELRSAAPDPGLGYRGFILRCTGKFAGMTCPVRIGLGAVQPADAPASLQDAHSSEKWLQTRAQRAGHTGLF